MCESGAWKNFEEIEEELTLDELILLYERTSERQQRLMKTVAAAMGADVSEPERRDVVQGPIQISDRAGTSTLFGYQETEVPSEG